MEEKTYINNVKEIIVKKINKGRNGICYLTKDNQVLKVINDINETKLSELMKYNSESFIFPKSLVYEKKSNKCIGYLMDYVDGMPVKFIPETTLLDKYTHSIKKIEEEIAKLTVYKLHIIDAGISNVLFDVNEDLKVVDTDFYEPKSELKNLYSVNMSSYNYGAIYPMIVVV